MAAPTFVSYTAVTSFTAIGTPKTVNVAVQTGDRIVVCAVTEDAGITVNTPSDGVNSYSQQENLGPGSHTRAAIWTATAASSTTLTISVTVSPNNIWGYGVFVFRGSDGFGAAESTNTTGGPSLGVTTTQANSALVFVSGDWNAVDGASRTWRQVNGANPTERTYAFSGSAYTVYIASYADAGATGAKTVGVSAPTGQKYTIAALEVKGTSSTTHSADGTRPTTATITGTAAVDRPASGSLALTATTAGAVTKAAAASGTLTVTATRTGAAVNAKLFKTLHQSIGHAPASIADIETAFSPNTASGGWHRGDGGMPIPGTGWTLYCCNDFYVSDGAGGVQALFRRNSVLMVDHDDGQVHWLSGGDGFPLAGSVTFPGPTSGGGWGWLNGGWETGAASCILFGAWWVSGSPYTLTEYRVMSVSSLTGASPIYSATHPTNLNHAGGVSWNGIPFVHDGRVLIYGIGNDFGMYLASCEISTDPTAYTTWSYWEGSGWSTDFADRATVSVQHQPLRALNVIEWGGRWLAAAKDFDSAPELGVPDAWTELKIWVSDNPTGPWRFHGIVADTSLADWWSYAGRVEVLPGMTELTAAWSVNTVSEFNDPDIYGLHFAEPTQVGVAEVAAAITGAAGFVLGGTGTRPVTVAAVGAALLEASAAGTRGVTATAVGAAAVDRPTAGDRSSTATATGAAAVARAGAGTLGTTALITGDATVHRPAAGTAAATATLTGAAAVARSAAGALPATATATGAAQSVANGTGATTVTATPAGSAAVDRPAAGVLAVSTTVTGAAAVIRPANGTLAVTVARTGAAAADQGATGALAATTTIAGTADVETPGQTDVDGDLATTATLTGAAVVVRAAAGALTVTTDRAGSAAITASTSGTLAITAPTGAIGEIVRPAGGQQLSTITVVGAATVDRAASGALAAIATIAGAASSIRQAGGVLAVALDLAGAATTDSEPEAGDGSLSAAVTITGAAAVTAGVTGERTVAFERTGYALLERPAAGVISTTATITGEATITRAAGGTLQVTVDRAAVAATEARPVTVAPPTGTGPVDDVQSSPAFNPGTGILTVTGVATGATIDRVDVSVDGATPAPATGTTSWTYLVDTAGWSPGPHTIAATAHMTGGGTSEPDTVTVWWCPTGMYGAAPTAGGHLIPVALSGAP